MEARITLVTLCVDDLERAVQFYRDGLGFATEGIIGQQFPHGAAAFFDLDNGLRLGLWPRASLAHNVASEEEVDEVMAQAALAGGTVVKPAQTTFWGGYGGYFHDPDGHLWEVAFNPELLPAD